MLASHLRVDSSASSGKVGERLWHPTFLQISSEPRTVSDWSLNCSFWRSCTDALTDWVLDFNDIQWWSLHWLVVSNMFYFPFHIWDGILPIDELIFFKMVKTTNQLLILPRIWVWEWGYNIAWRIFVDPLISKNLSQMRSRDMPEHSWKMTGTEIHLKIMAKPRSVQRRGFVSYASPLEWFDVSENMICHRMAISKWGTYHFFLVFPPKIFRQSHNHIYIVYPRVFHHPVTQLP